MRVALIVTHRRTFTPRDTSRSLRAMLRPRNRSTPSLSGIQSVETRYSKSCGPTTVSRVPQAAQLKRESRRDWSRSDRSAGTMPCESYRRCAQRDASNEDEREVRGLT